MEIRGKTIAYASNKKKESRRVEEELLLNIKALEENLNETNKEEYENERDELRRLREKKLEGMIIRSRFKRELEGEKNSSIFFKFREQTVCKQCNVKY